MTPTITTQQAVRDAFWEAYFPDGIPRGIHTSKRQNDQPTDLRCAFVDFVDSLERSGTISRQLAYRVTL